MEIGVQTHACMGAPQCAVASADRRGQGWHRAETGWAPPCSDRFDHPFSLSIYQRMRRHKSLRRDRHLLLPPPLFTCVETKLTVCVEQLAARECRGVCCMRDHPFSHSDQAPLLDRAGSVPPRQTDSGGRHAGPDDMSATTVPAAAVPAAQFLPRARAVK
jgi:hypothetical protein